MHAEMVVSYIEHKLALKIMSLRAVVQDRLPFAGSDVHGLASGQKPSQAKSVGLELALAWPGLPESQSQRPRPWLSGQYFAEISALHIALVVAQQA
jgi:hypothetical protein